MKRDSIVKVLSALAVVAGVVAGAEAQVATSYTGGMSNSFTVGTVRVNNAGATPASRTLPIGGNGVVATNYPAFVVYEFNGAAYLSGLRNSVGNSSYTVASVTGLTLNLADEATNGVDGSFNFWYVENSVAITSGATTPLYDISDTGGLTTQLGALMTLGTGTYTHATVMNTALPAYGLTGGAAYEAIGASINSGSTFRIVVEAGTASTKATLNGFFGLSPFITAPSLTINAVVPEPAVMGMVMPVGLLLLRRRRV